MVPKKTASPTFAPREKQIMDVLFQLGRASVSEVREKLADPPSYSAVRTMIGQLERKGYVRRDRSDVKHYYSPVESKRSAARSALRSVIDTFFPRSPGDALAALIDDSAMKLTEEDLDRLEQAIKKARKQGQ
ncbi:MAG: BlaI/MecI/CopY family transcriptional regulator [Planctomycetales bacterium]|nr:BlaI/MecI/CopY family transcriptional regulator [Planctomycetales bacterium]MCA9170141.1 BlaI/MecI/CopY family transcriptional regulator [Planctomycetales bacterium]